MAGGTTLLDGAEHEPGPPDDAVRSRDADGTRRRLLHAARRRFAHHGYTGTTVRDIAADAGVNVALINRYFDSKEGLFESCLRRAVEDLDRPTGAPGTVGEIVETMIGQLTGSPADDHSLQLLLLLRSSGDVRADEIRRTTLLSFAEGIAAVAAGPDADTTRALPDDALLLRAQLALSTVLGIILLRSSTGLEPLTSATDDELRGPLGEALSSFLG